MNLLHKGEQRTAEYLAMNPNGQVPVLVVDGRALTQIVALCDFIDRARFFFPERYAGSDAARAEVKKRAAEEFHGYLERIGKTIPSSGYWLGERISFHDAYAFTLLRWGGFAGIDPRSLPAYHAYAERVMRAPPVAAAAARERIALDTYRG